MSSLPWKAGIPWKDGLSLRDYELAVSDHKQIEKPFIWSFSPQGHDFWMNAYLYGYTPQHLEILRTWAGISHKSKKKETIEWV